MRCPACQTINRDDREECYHCGQDLKMLRLIVNRARQHYNEAAEHLERGRLVEALAELQNALELDAKFEEARILRGIIFLRLERPEDARREWDKALEANLHSARAHRYLNDLGPVSRVLPVVRRVYGLLAACAAVVLLSFAAVIAAQRPSDLENRLREAWTSFGIRRMADAQELVRALPRPLPRPHLEDSATLLEDSITAIEQRALASAERALFQGDIQAAAEILDALEALVPTSGTRIALERLRQGIKDIAMESIIPQDPSSLSSIQSAHARLRTAAPWLGENAQAAEQQLRTAAQQLLAQRRAQWHAALEANPEDPALVAGIAEVQQLAELSALPAPTNELQEALDSARGQHRLRLAKEALEANDMAAFDDATRRAESIATARDEVNALRAALADRQRNALIARLRTALEENNRSNALLLAREAEQLGIALPQEWSTQLDRLRERRSIEAYYALLDRADELERGTLHADDARAVLDLVQQAREALPPRLAASAQSHLHFFAAVAWRSAGEENRAQEEIAVLSELFSQSPYLDRWKSFTAAP